MGGCFSKCYPQELNDEEFDALGLEEMSDYSPGEMNITAVQGHASEPKDIPAIGKLQKKEDSPSSEMEENPASAPVWRIPGEKWLRQTGPDDRNCWAEPDASDFMVRGPGYTSPGKNKGVKQRSLESAFQLTSCQVLKTRKQMFHYASAVRSLREWLKQHLDGTYLIVTWVLPGSPGHAIVHLYERVLPVGEDPAFDNAFDRFREGDAEYRCARFKFCNKMVDGPQVVMSSVAQFGGERPALIGSKLTVQHHDGPNYLEVDMDVSSSFAAKMLQGVILKEFASIALKYVFIIEGKEEDELPERVLGGCFMQKCMIDECAKKLSVKSGDGIIVP